MTSSEKIEPAYVIDTHTLIWYLKNDKKLSPRASEIFEAAERGETKIIISAITMAELDFADVKWRLFKDFSATYNDLLSKPYFEFVSFTVADVVDLKKDAAVPEMHDRMITGLARRLNVPLVTSDVQIVAANLVQIVW